MNCLKIVFECWQMQVSQPRYWQQIITEWTKTSYLRKSTKNWRFMLDMTRCMSPRTCTTILSIKKIIDTSIIERALLWIESFIQTSVRSLYTIFCIDQSILRVGHKLSYKGLSPPNIERQNVGLMLAATDASTVAALRFMSASREVYASL